MENVNIFGETQGEIGSLEKNLVLRTKGQVYIRFGRKYIELLDSNGNLNIKVPKVLKKIKSNKEISDNGFYILDENLYAYFDGELIQINGIEGRFISYVIEQKLTQEQINTVQKNIGIKFKSLTDAKNIVEEGIVFINNKIYYINNGEETEILNKLLSSLNNSGLSVPEKNNYCITWKDGRWIFQRFATYQELLESSLNNTKKTQEKNEYYNYIEYSKYYKFYEYSIIGNQSYVNFSNGITNIKSIPEFNQNSGDVFIVTLEVGIVDEIISFSYKQQEYTGLTCLKNNGEVVKYILVLSLKYDSSNNGLYYIGNSGEQIYICYKNVRLFNDITFINQQNASNILNEYKKGTETGYIKIGNQRYIIEESLEKLFLNKSIYVKSDSDPYKFKIDHKNSEIALEENYSTINQNNAIEFTSTPHVILGDLDDTQKYYNDPAISFKTHNDDPNSHGLFSDLNVFVGGEFREPLDSQTTIMYYHFPRYSTDLTNKCELFLNNDEIILPKKWIPRVANYIEDLTGSNSSTLITQDDSLYDGKLFLYKVIGTSNNNISVRFEFPNGNRTSFYDFYREGVQTNESDYNQNTILLAQYRNGNPGLINVIGFGGGSSSTSLTEINRDLSRLKATVDFMKPYFNITISSSSLTFQSTNQPQSITVSSIIDWSVKSVMSGSEVCSWCTTSISNGNLIIGVNNNTSGTSRTAIITLSNGIYEKNSM